MMDDSMRAKARATFGKEFMDVMKPQAPAKNEAVALQKRANARPIPTYKVGGAVKAPQPTAAERAASKAQDESLKKAKVTKKEAEVIKSANRSEGGGYKKGGKVGLYSNIAAKRDRIKAGSGEKMRKPGSKGAPTDAAFKAAAKTAKYKDGGKVHTSSDTARALATEMGGMKNGGACKPVKKMNGGKMDAPDMEATKAVRGLLEAANTPSRYAAGGAGKMRKGMCEKPVKRAQGGAGKVRKGMMTQSGQITPGVRG